MMIEEVVISGIHRTDHSRHGQSLEIAQSIVVCRVEGTLVDNVLLLNVHYFTIIRFQIS